MQIAGLQKLTLLDFPGQVACTVFLPGCNFTCPFCHNAALVTAPRPEETMTPEAFLGFLRGRRGILDGVCVTGGEPTLHPDLDELLRAVRNLGFAVKLDTNGYAPEVLKRLCGKGLVDYVAMDIKNAPEKYAETTGLHEIDMGKINESIAFLKSGAVDFEFRTTVVREFHTAEDMLALAEWIRGDMPYFLQEFKDTGGLICSGLHGWDKGDMQALLQQLRPLLPRAELREM